MTSIPVTAIKPNPQQPRTVFDGIEYLAESIKQEGLLHPILVEDNGDATYTIVSGERRWRAHKLLGLETIEATIRQVTNHSGRSLLVDAMTENVSRDDMNPVDEANGYKRLRDEYHMSIRQISIAVGAKENRVQHMLLISDMEPEIQALIKTGRLPSSRNAVQALRAIEASGERVKMAEGLAKRGATIDIVVRACDKYVTARKQKAAAGKHRAAAIQFAERVPNLPEWDALYQLGKVPPWPVVNDAVMATCDGCAIRPHASPETCRTCPLVEAVRRMVDLSNVHK